MKGQRAPVLFVSHHSSKLPVAEHIEKSLTARGVRCWMAPRDVDPGEPFDKAVMEAIGDASAILLLFCSKSEKSRHVKRELILADQHHKPIIPLRLERIDPGELSYHLADSQWIDWIEKRDAVVDKVAAKAKEFEKARGGGEAPLPPEPDPDPAPPPEPEPKRDPDPVPPPPPPDGRADPARRWLPLAALGGGVLLLAVAALALQGGENPPPVPGPAIHNDLEPNGEDPIPPGPIDDGGDKPAVAANQPAGIDCAAPETHLESLVCGSAELTALNNQWFSAFERASAAADDPQGLAMLEQQWAQQVHANCNNENCLAAAYRERIELYRSYGF